MRDADLIGRGHRVLWHLIGKGMGGVDKGVHVTRLQLGDETVDSAEPADAHGTGKRAWSRRTPGEGRHHVDTAIYEDMDERGRLRCAGQDENGHRRLRNR
jgi:hypothetical protein